MDTVPRLPVNSLSLPALSYGVGGSGWWLSEGGGGLRLMNGALCLSDPLHFIPDRQQGLQVVAEGAAESDLMTGLCLVLGFSSG